MGSSARCLKNPSWEFYNSVTRRTAPWRGGGERCCSVCAAHYRRKLQEKVSRLLAAGKVEFEQNKVRFFTLTLNGNDFAGLQVYWERLRSSLRRKYGMTVNFIAVRQVGEKGRKSHLHGFIDRFIDQRVLTELWRDATGGRSYVVHIEEVKIRDVKMQDLRNVAQYVSRYVSRGDVLPVGVRRYSVAYRLYKLLRDVDTGVKEKGWVMAKHLNESLLRAFEAVSDVFGAFEVVPELGQVPP